MAGNPQIAEEYEQKAARLRRLVQEKLWDPQAQFFKTLPRSKSNDGEDQSREAAPVDVRELHGFTPWYFHLPEDSKGYEVAWKQLTDPAGFRAPFGPTSAERRHPEFKSVSDAAVNRLRVRMSATGWG